MPSPLSSHPLLGADDKKTCWRIYGGAALGALLIHVAVFFTIGSGFIDNNKGNDYADEGRIEVTLDPDFEGLENDETETLDDPQNEIEVSEYSVPDITPDLAHISEEVLDFQPEIPVLPLPTEFPDIIPDSNISSAEHYTPFDFTPPQPATKKTSASRNNVKRNNSKTSGEGTSMGVTGNSGGTVSPPRFKSNPKPPYPSNARKEGNEGTVRLRISLDSGGNITSVSISKSSGYGELDKAAREYVQARWQFYPAKKEGNPVPWTVIVPIVFSLESK